MMRRGVGWLIVLLLFCLSGIGHAEELIDKIVFLGNVRIEEGTLRTAIKSREGAPSRLSRFVRICALSLP